MESKLLTIQDIFDWWYNQRVNTLNQRINRLMLILDDKLSLSFLLKTFFVPWHRDNSLLGIPMGITMRLLYLPFGGGLFLLVASISYLYYVLHYILPFLLLLLPVIFIFI